MRPRLCLLIVISIASLGATCGSAKPGRAIESPAAERVAAHYETWKRSRAPGGLTVRLGFAKGITSRRHQMGAVASVDLADNSLVVEAYGLPVPADVWWVDNRSGPDASALPDAGDEFVLVGSLAAGRSSVQRALGATAAGERKLNALPLMIGADVSGNGDRVDPHSGSVDEVRLSKGARYVGEQFTPQRRHTSDEDTLLLLHADAATGPWLHDSSSQGAHPTLLGGARVQAEL